MRQVAAAPYQEDVNPELRLIGEKIIYCCEKQGIKDIHALSIKSGVGDSTLSRIISGRQEAKILTLSKIADALEVSPSYLLSGISDEPATTAIAMSNVQENLMAMSPSFKKILASNTTDKKPPVTNMVSDFLSILNTLLEFPEMIHGIKVMVSDVKAMLMAQKSGKVAGIFVPFVIFRIFDTYDVYEVISVLSFGPEICW